MLNRTVSLAVCLSVIAGAALAQSISPGTGYVFEFANSSGASGQLQAFTYNTTSLNTPVFSTTGPLGANQVIPKPDGTKFYVVGSGGIDDFGPSFSTPAALNGISGAPTQAIISPDGRYLLVASNLGGGASAIYVLNTTTDTIVPINGSQDQPFSGSVVGMVVSRDSSTVWVLGNEGGNAVILTISLTKQQEIGSPVFLRDYISGDSLGGNPQALTMSPMGLLYVSAGNQILEFNPATLQTAAPSYVEISVNATVGPLRFASDGSIAYFVNTDVSTGGRSLGSLSIPGHALTYSAYVAGQAPELFDSIYVASSPAGQFSSWRLLAHSPGDSTLWDVAPDLSSITVSSLNSILTATSVTSMAISNELPTAQYLYALVGSGTQASLYRVNLATNLVSSQASAALAPGILQFAIVPPATNPTGFITFNASQLNLSAGATANTLIARVLDPLGRPMFGVPVTFTDPTGTLVFTNVTSVTNKDGYAQATASFPTAATPGNYPVTLTAGTGSATATTVFSLAIPGGGTGPTGPSNGPNLMTIVGGNGQLFPATFSNGSTVPLTIQEVTSTGAPVVNDNVTFTVNAPLIGAFYGAYTYSATTDTNGMAYVTFQPQGLLQDIPFEGTTVTVSGTQGTVTFNESVYQLNPDGETGAPTIGILVPSGPTTITAGEGAVVPNAIKAVVYAQSFGVPTPIPNIAINITNPDGTGNAGPGTCQGNPLTDNTGTVTCNFVPVCATAINASTMLPWGLGLHGFVIDFGNYNDQSGYSVNILQGTASALAIQTGNNQTGRPGQALTLPLTATVTDGCGVAAQGATVTWAVTQGSASLAQTTTVSNQGGTVANHVTLGNSPGTVTITASLNSSTLATFTETAQAVVGSLTLVTGSGQSALLNQTFATPLVFQLTDTSGNPVPNLTVNFGIGSGSATLNATQGTTNAKGQVSVTVTAGNTAGVVTILATYSTFTASAILNVTAPGPSITMSSFENAASGQAGLTPCGLTIVTGSGLAAGINGVVLGSTLGIGPLPYTLAGVTITIDGIPAPLQAVSNQNGVQQVNFQTPCEIPTGTPATVIVQVGSVVTQVAGVTVYPAQPGIFTYAGPSGLLYAYVIDSSGNALTPSNPATPGQTYYLFATGMGAIPGVKTNSEGNGTQTLPVSSIILGITDIGVPVTSVQYVEGALGEYLITFTIPSGFAAGTNVPVSLGITINGQTFFANQSVVLPSIN
jgi:uncharacterized protein (TIGR03437 family)